MRPSPGGVSTPIHGSGALAEAVLDAFECAVVVCGPDGSLLYANAEARALSSGANPSADACAQFPLLDAEGTELSGPEHPLARALSGERIAGCHRFVPEPGGGRVRVELSARPFGLGGALMVFRPPFESESEARLRTYVSDFEILTEVSRLLADVQDADEAASIICTVTIGSTGALAVFLWEREGEGLSLRWHESLLGRDALECLTEHVRDGATRAFAARRQLVEFAEADAYTDPSVELPAATAWHEPLMAAGRPTGTLSIIWPGELTDLERPGWLAEALGYHAASALERADLVRRLHAAARTDPLTGLANRRVWSERLDHELSRSEREGTPLSLILIDIDRFKHYNDRFGHPQGDLLLHAAAAAWQTQLRSTDLLARVGGEEFAVLLPTCPLDDACAVAERLRLAMPLDETCSLGVTTWDGSSTASQLYAIADTALYRAKAHGRNRVQIGEPVGENTLRLTP